MQTEEFTRLVTQLKGDEETRVVAATRLYQSYNLSKAPASVKDQVREILGGWAVLPPRTPWREWP